MDAVTTILTRRTAHVYDDRPVDEAIMKDAFRCATRAPNHKLTNPWRFVRVGPVTRERLVELAVTVKRERGPLSERQAAKVREKVGSSAELVVVVQVLTADDFQRREDYASCACAIQNMALALWSAGVSSKWATGAITRDPRTYSLLDVDPETHEIVGFVFVGYAREQPETPRMDVEEVVRRVP